MRISDRAAFAAALALAGCSGQGGAGGADTARSGRSDAAAATPVEDPALRIACAHGDAAFARDCTVDRTQTARGAVLTVRHPDGHFRRLLVTADGRGVAAADGAEVATVALVQGQGQGQGIEVRVGGDRYRLPATVKGAGPQR